MTKKELKKLIRECINEVSSDTQGMYENKDVICELKTTSLEDFLTQSGSIYR